MYCRSCGGGLEPTEEEGVYQCERCGRLWRYQRDGRKLVAAGRSIHWQAWEEAE